MIFGAGFLGRRLAGAIPGARLSHVDIANRAAVAAALREAGALVAINAAGKTGRPNVDWCELHPYETYRSNVLGTSTLAEVCAERGIYLLHLGSGCIFSGPSPGPEGFHEYDLANPTSFYAWSKYAADLRLSAWPSFGIVRLRMPIDRVPHERNLITKLASYGQVVDVENSVTVVDDLIDVVRRLVEQRATGIFHVVNPGILRHRELLALYRRLVDSDHRYTLIEEPELVQRGLVLKPRSNCVLASPRLAELGIRLRPIEEALESSMSGYAEARRMGAP